MSKKQSSVEWLFVELWNTPKDKFDWQSIFEQAKAMHKEEIYEAWEDGHLEAALFASTKGLEMQSIYCTTCEDYYKEIFGGQDNE